MKWLCKPIPLLLFYLFSFYSPQNLLASTNSTDSLILKRFIPSSTFLFGSWIGSTVALQQVWYSSYPKTKFHFYNDMNNWLQMDKIGHLYSANKLCSTSHNLFRWSNVSQNKSILISSFIGLGYLTTLELMDATNEEWGFSVPDMAANVLGTGLFIINEKYFQKNPVLLKFSFSRTSFASVRPAVLGKNYSEQLLKDYNGQTYWLSFFPTERLIASKIPAWLGVSLGYSVDQKLVGTVENYYHATTSTYYNSGREFILSMDINLNKLPIKNKRIKQLIRPFNSIKIPFPAMIYSKGQLGFNPFYF